MHFLARQFVNDRLRLSVCQSYRIVGRSANAYGARIRSDYIVELLNRARCGNQSVVTDLPNDIVTADEMAAELSESEITAADLIRWTNRRRNPLPHYRLNKHTRRFRRANVLEWLKETSVSRRFTA